MVDGAADTGYTTEVVTPDRCMPGPLLTWIVARPSRTGRWLLGIVALAVTGPLLLLAGAAALGLVGLVVDALVGGNGPLAAHRTIAIVGAWLAVIALAAVGVRIGRRRARSGRGTLAGDDQHPVAPESAVESAPESAVESGSGSGADERWRDRGWRGGLVEVTVYLGVAALLLWPVWLHPLSRAMGVPGDPPYYVWLGWRVGEAFRHGDFFPTHLTGAVHPFGIDTLLLDGLLPSWVNGWFNLLGGPLLAYNLTLMVGSLANLTAGRTLARGLSPRRLVWVATAVAFATAPTVAARLSVHLPFVFAFTQPLLLLEGIIVARGDRAYRPVRVAVLLVVAYLCSAYFLIFGLVLLITPVVVARMQARSDRDRAEPEPTAATNVTVVRTLALALVITGLALLPFVVTRLHYSAAERAAGGHEQLDDEAGVYAGDALAPITPPTALTVPEPVPTIDLGQPPPVWAWVFPGWLLLMGLSGVVLLRFRLRLPLLVTAGLTWLLTLGPSLRIDGHVIVTDRAGAAIDWLPYRALLAVPGLSALRVPSRVGLTLAGVLAAGLAISLTAAVVRRPGRRAQVAMAAAVAAGVALNLLLPAATFGLGVSPAIHDALVEVRDRGSGPGDAVLRVPADCNRVDPDTILLQVVHHRPSLGCSTTPASTRWMSQLDPWAESAALASLRCDQDVIGRRSTPFTGGEVLDEAGVQSLRDELGVRFIIIDETAAPLCADVVASLPALRAHEVVGADGRFTVIDLDHPA